MAKKFVNDGYNTSYYFYWATFSDGSKYISNSRKNYIRIKYSNSDYKIPKEGGEFGDDWDYPRRVAYPADPSDIEYVLLSNGAHPTVSGNGAKLIGGASNDTIKNGGASVKISAGKGNDEIYNSGSKVTINAGDGKNTVENGGSSVTINGGKGNDSIKNYGSKVTINAGDGKNTVENGGSSVTINGGKGNDSISNYGSKVTINAGDGKNTVENYDDNVKIYTGKDNDSIKNGVYGYASKVTINAGDGKNTVENYGNNVKISAGAGNDKIYSSGFNVTIDAGNGKNLISLTGGEDISLKTGKDTDSVVIVANSFAYTKVSIDSGEGKNLISLFGGWDSHNFVSLNGGDNEISIDSNRNTVVTGAGDDKVTVNGDHNSIVAGTKDLSAKTIGKNNIIVNGFSNTIETGNGSDTVWIKTGYNYHSMIDTGFGKDSIRNDSTGVSINSGYDNDTITNYARFVTIRSGKLNVSAGKNFIENYADEVTLSGGGDKDTIKNSGKAVSINAGAGSDVVSLYGGVPLGNLFQSALEPLGKAQQDLIQKRVEDLLGDFVEFDTNYNYIGKKPNKAKKKLNKIIEDADSVSDYIEKANAALDKLGGRSEKLTKMGEVCEKVSKYAGKIVNAIDHAEILGGVIEDYSNNKLFSLALKDLLSDFEKDENGRWCFAFQKAWSPPATVKGGKGNDKIYSDGYTFHVYDYTAGDGKDIIYGWNVKDTLKIHGASYSGKVKGKDYVLKVGKGSITFKNFTSRSVKQSRNGKTFPLIIEGDNEAPYYNPVVNSPKKVIVNYGWANVAEDFSGIIDLNENWGKAVDRIDAAATSNGVDITGNDSTKEIKSGSGKDKVRNLSSSAIIRTGSGNDMILNSGNENTIFSGNGNDTIVNFGDANTIYSGTGKDKIISNGEKNIFSYDSGGNKIIYGFGATDTLKIAKHLGTYSKKKSGKNIVVTVGDGKISLMGAASLSSVNVKSVKSPLFITLTKRADSYENYLDDATIQALGGNDTIFSTGVNVTIEGGAGNDTVLSNVNGTANSISGGAGNDNLRNFGRYSTINGGVGNDTIYNTGSNVSINAGDGNDTIRTAGFNVTIKGGKGNDTLWGNGSTETFLYSKGDGKDTIFGFDNTDTLTFDNLTFKTSYSKNNKAVTFNFDSKNTITLKNFTATTFHVNKSTYKISGSKLVKK